MIILSASIVLATLMGIVTVMVYGAEQVPLWMDGLFWGLISAGMVVRLTEICLHTCSARFTSRLRGGLNAQADNKPDASVSPLR